jgi:hypothetical protein
MDKKTDLILLVVFPILASILVLATEANLLLSIFLFYGLPGVWLSIRHPQKIQKSLIFSSFFIIPAIVLDALAIYNKTWHVPSMFPRIFGLATVEDIIFVVFMIYTTVMFYEYFFDKGMQKTVSPKMKYLLFIILAMFGLFLIGLNMSFLRIPYFYFWAGVVLFLVPSVVFLTIKKDMIRKFVKTGAYFFGLTFLFEITSLHLEQWSFPSSEFVGYVTVMGLGFPLEEAIFWFVLCAVNVLVFFEVFDDDMK